MKFKLDIYIAKISQDIELKYCIKDITLYQYGQTKDTSYDSKIMTHGAMTAKDDTYRYYKNTNGYLMKESIKDNTKEVIYTKDFFKICGIDKSYIYLLIKSEEEGYDIYRVAKEGKTSKVIVTNVSNCFYEDSKYLYYVEESDEKEIRRIDRELLNDSSFAKLDYNVEIMLDNGDSFYVVTRDPDNIFSGLSWLFGNGNNGNYFITISKSDGTVIKTVKDEEATVQDYYISSEFNYSTAVRFLSSGPLRYTASEMYWLSPDKQTNVKTEGSTGWSKKDIGIITVSSNSDPATSQTSPYELIFYRKQDGTKIRMTDIIDKNAMFTLNQAESGSWYYFDQTSDKTILYRMNSDFSSKVVEKEFNEEELSCKLENCSLEIMDNCLYFYTIPNDDTSEVLYRYDLY